MPPRRLAFLGLLLLLLLAVPTGAASAASPRAPTHVGGPIARAPGSTTYGWPLVGRPTVTRRFDPPPQPWLAGHRGVDLAGTVDATVLAAGSGTVVFAGVIAGRGVVSIEHPGGLRTTYEPVQPLVRAGQAVRVGQPIALLDAGHLGCPVDACLHWGLRRGDVYLDPLSLLSAGRVRLLRLEPADKGG
jgi:murein DD-endopeptidase MepM/ murein hydrolase activator NlpD